MKIGIFLMIAVLFSCKPRVDRSELDGSKQKKSTKAPKRNSLAETKRLYGERPVLFDHLANQPFWPLTCPNPDRQNSLYRYYLAAINRKLPVSFFCELMSSDVNIEIINGDFFRFVPPTMLSNGKIQIAASASGKKPEEWGKMIWSGFYNELFHAFWNSVFLKDVKYSPLRQKLLSKKNLQRYEHAISKDFEVALEEGLSETISRWIASINIPDVENNSFRYPTLSFYKYWPGETVMSVSHYEQVQSITIYGKKIENKMINNLLKGRAAQYLPAAEYTYPSKTEYSAIFKIFFGQNPPQN